MNQKNLTFNSNLDEKIVKWASPILLNFLGKFEEEIFVKNIMIFQNEIFFMVNDNSGEKIIRVQMDIS